ncbi:Hypothetical predicted protein [Podarcis lilfordi]|uniref:Uncharacterized protein n=1 Tax=Podarcis lilfordi TaxID=74358 RepID=A0AA35KTY2_9SAUR|nr:Hypothetical predicted protein [Podarcis lilfordi]
MEKAAAGGGAEPPGRREAATLPGPSRDTGQRDKKRTSRETPVEKRGPYLMSKTPSIQDKLRKSGLESTLHEGTAFTKKHREMAKAMLRRKGGAFSGAVRHQPKLPVKRSVKFNKGYAALSQISDETLVSLDSDSDEELESRCSSGYSSAEASLVHGLLLTSIEIDLQVVGFVCLSV